MPLTAFNFLAGVTDIKKQKGLDKHFHAMQTQRGHTLTKTNKYILYKTHKSPTGGFKQITPVK